MTPCVFVPQKTSYKSGVFEIEKRTNTWGRGRQKEEGGDETVKWRPSSLCLCEKFRQYPQVFLGL